MPFPGECWSPWVLCVLLGHVGQIRLSHGICSARLMGAAGRVPVLHPREKPAKQKVLWFGFLMQLLLKLLSAVKLHGGLKHPLKSLFPHPGRSRSSRAAQDGTALTPPQALGCFAPRPGELPACTRADASISCSCVSPVIWDAVLHLLG